MSLKEVRETLERDMILSALTRHRGNMTKTAEELGITRPTLYDLMSKLTIRVTQTGEEEQRAKP
jgi:two-component system NtrC family response regulator